MALQSINWSEITFKSLKIWLKLSNSLIIAHVIAEILPKLWPNLAEILAQWTVVVVVIISSKVSIIHCYGLYYAL